MGYAEAEYRKLKELVEFLGRVIEGKDKDLHEAEMALKGNIGKPETLRDLERNLRNARVKILSELTGIVSTTPDRLFDRR